LENFVSASENLKEDSLSHYRNNIKSIEEHIQNIHSSDDIETIASCEAQLLKFHLFLALEKKSWMKEWMSENESLDVEKLDLSEMKSNSEWAYLKMREYKKRKKYLEEVSSCEASFSVHDRASAIESDRLNVLQKELKEKGRKLLKYLARATNRTRAFTSRLSGLCAETIRQYDEMRCLEYNSITEHISRLQEQHKRLFGISITL
jgi:hypothetical protein